MTKLVFNIVTPNNNVTAVVGKSDSSNREDYTFNLPTIAVTPNFGSVVWEVSFLPPCCILGTDQNPSRKAQGFNTRPDKVRAMSFLTTRDLHANKKGRPRYIGLVLRPDVFEVQHTFPLFSFDETPKKCRDIKERLCTN